MKNQRKLPIFLRGLAAATLAVFILSQFVCALHCAFGMHRQSAFSLAQSCCHKKSDPAPLGANPIAKSSCVVFKSMFPATAAKVEPPAAPLAVITILVPLERTAEPALQISSELREISHPDCIIAHEVSLGSDARSHAPPLLA
jgi:hypothetical protein